MSIQNVMTTDQLRRAIDALPRVPLAHLPTPFEPLPRFSAAIGGPPVWIKRDDCTGLAFGGNKTRHNEYVMAHAQELGADVFVWGAGVQSNNCRQTAAACAKLGLECRLILSRGCHAEDVQGNLLVDHLVGAHVDFVDAPVGPELDDVLADAARQLAAQGRRPYCWDRDVVKPRAAVSYVLCMVETAEQAAAAGIEPAAVYVCSCGSTGAGLALGRAALGLPCPVRNVAPIVWPWDTPADLARIANEAAELVALPHRLAAEDIELTEDYIGAGYGLTTPGGMEAIELVARTEGILLDPVYTGKAMAALIDDVRQGRLDPDRPVVFVHTGGTPALFAYRDDLVRDIPARP